MSWMNEHEIDEAMCWFDPKDQPNLHRGALVLARLMGWTNSCSDGWPYWQKPSKAAAKLMTLIQNGRELNRRNYGDLEDVTAADLTKAISPIKAMLTRHGVEHTTKVQIVG